MRFIMAQGPTPQNTNSYTGAHQSSPQQQQLQSQSFDNQGATYSHHNSLLTSNDHQSSLTANGTGAPQTIHQVITKLQEKSNLSNLIQPSQ